MEQNIKYFDLELIENFLIKIQHNRTRFNLFIFDHSKLNNSKKIQNKDFSNGIYFLTKKNAHDKLYIGQTTNGIDRFNRHNFIEQNKEEEIRVFFFDLNPDRINKNILDFIERGMILEVGSGLLENKTKGNSSNITPKDLDYANTIIDSIRDFMLLFDFNLKTSNDEEVYYEEETKTINFRPKNQIISAINEYLSIRKDWVTKKEINDYMISKFKDDLLNKRWASEYGLQQVISRDLQIHSDGFKTSSEDKQLFITKRNEKDKVTHYKIKDEI